MSSYNSSVVINNQNKKKTIFEDFLTYTDLQQKCEKTKTHSIIVLSL